MTRSCVAMRGRRTNGARPRPTSANAFVQVSRLMPTNDHHPPLSVSPYPWSY